MAKTRDQERETCLHIAARHVNTSLVKDLLAAGSDIECRDRYSATPLHHAVTSGCHEVVCILLSAGASVHALDELGRNALHCAACSRNKSAEDIHDIVVDLTKRSCDSNRLSVHGLSAIRRAVLENHVGAFRALYGVGAKIKQTQCHGWTILHLAAVHVGFEMFLAFEELETDTIDPDLVDDFGYTAADLFQQRQRRAEAGRAPLTRRLMLTDEEKAVFERMIAGMRGKYQAKQRVQDEEDRADRSVKKRLLRTGKTRRRRTGKRRRRRTGKTRRRRTGNLVKSK